MLDHDHAFNKECKVCGRHWSQRDEYIADTTELSELTDVGLSLRNCKCGTTHGTKPEELWPDKASYYKGLWDTDPRFKRVNGLRAKEREKYAIQETKECTNSGRRPGF